MTISSKTPLQLPSVQVENLTVHYGHQTALWDLSFSIPQGKLVGIVGPNGAGKSTLLKALLQLLPVSSGKVQFMGLPLSQAKQLVAYVPQKESVDWDFPITVKELVLMGRYSQLKFFERPKASDYKLVDHYLEKVGLTSFANRQISELSGGQQQRAFLARAMIQNAMIYLLDEPFVGIDQTTEQVLLQILKEMKNSGKTVFVVHHDLGTIKEDFDSAILLNMHLVAVGAVDDVFTKEHLKSAYGEKHHLLDEALKLSNDRIRGQ